MTRRATPKWTARSRCSTRATSSARRSCWGDCLRRGPRRGAPRAPPRLRIQPGPRDSLVATLLVDSIATARVPAALSQGGAWPTGEYAIIGEVAPSEPGSSDLLQLRVERLPVDTIPQKALRPAIFRPETLSG